MGLFGGGSDAGKDARREEAKRQRRITQGLAQIDDTFSGFDDDFYREREGAYLDTVTPRLNQQFDETRKNLAYQLARTGLGTSGTAIERSGSLDRELGNKQREVADAALNSTNQLRGEVEGQRSQLVSQLNASGNPALINQGLIASNANLRAPSPVGPIGNFFSDWTSLYLANQNARKSDPAVQPIFQFGGNNSGTRTVTSQ